MPKTFITTARCDIEDIATIANYLLANEIRNITKSGIVGKSTKILAEIIRSNHPGMTFDTQQALSFLESVGIDLRQKRGITAIAKKLQSDHLDEIVRDEIQEPKFQPKNPAEESIISTEDKQEAEKRRKAELDEHLKAFSKLPSILAD